MSFLFVCCAGALQISDSQETDQGKYECVAENSVGTQHATAIMLWVRGECAILVLFFLFKECILCLSFLLLQLLSLFSMFCVIYVRFPPYELPPNLSPTIVRVKKQKPNQTEIPLFPIHLLFPFIYVCFFFIQQQDLCTIFFKL